LRIGAWNLGFNYSNTHYSSSLRYRGKILKAPSSGSSKPGPSGLDSLFLPKSVREPVDLVAKPSNHEKVIGETVKINSNIPELFRVLTPSLSCRKPHHMSLGSAADSSCHMSPDSRDVPPREKKILQVGKPLIYSINGPLQTLAVLFGNFLEFC